MPISAALHFVEGEPLVREIFEVERESPRQRRNAEESEHASGTWLHRGELTGLGLHADRTRGAIEHVGVETTGPLEIAVHLAVLGFEHVRVAERTQRRGHIVTRHCRLQRRLLALRRDEPFALPFAVRRSAVNRNVLEADAFRQACCLQIEGTEGAISEPQLAHMH
jgi:hypothetical protein